ncbi:hypothetical protein QBC42DRAFT_314393 [Cladorrhinum samala]|uniref:Uncharacterized protein n=1 Tax=Cladorrhinum samala TaxID=585594 RepID=A0AAV9I080_9PEZI|nr:hypothetical protein QBC42DRAFT_314393 [Cladorrhinum samala]
MTTNVSSHKLIAEEFFRLLSRPALHGIECSDICICQQFAKAVHLVLPRWPWGVQKVVCFGLGSWINVLPDGRTSRPYCVPYGEVYKDKGKSKAFSRENEFERDDALQVMFRHVAVLDILVQLRVGANPRGLEHAVGKGMCRMVNKLAEPEVKGWGNWVEGGEDWENFVEGLKRARTKLEGKGEMRRDLPRVEVVFCGDEKNGDSGVDAQVYREIDRLLTIIWGQEVRFVSRVEEGLGEIDERTMVYCVDVDFPLRDMVLRRGKRPVVMVWRSAKEEQEDEEGGDVLWADMREVMKREYQEFRLDKERAPHTIGSSQLHLRVDAGRRAVNEDVWPTGYKPREPFDYGSVRKLGWFD